MIKQLLSTLAISCAICTNISASNNAYVNEQSFKQGATTDLTVYLWSDDESNNPAAIQGQIVLPTGLSFAKDSSGNYTITNGERINGHNITVAEVTEGTLSFVVLGYPTAKFNTGDTKDLFKVQVACAEDATTGDADITVAEQYVSDADGVTAEWAQSSTTTVKITDASGIEGVDADSDVQIVGGVGTIQIIGATDATSIYGIDGTQFVANGFKSVYEVDKGIYIVKVGNVVKKIRVK